MEGALIFSHACQVWGTYNGRPVWEPRMNEVYLWIVTAAIAAVAASTISRLWTDRARLWRDELQDEDRLFAWRIVLFLIYPLLVAVDLRSTLAAAQVFGGY